MGETCVNDPATTTAPTGPADRRHRQLIKGLSLTNVLIIALLIVDRRADLHRMAICE